MVIIEKGDKYQYDVTFPIKVECDYCGSTLMVEKEDLTDGEFGAMWYRCPVCKRRCMADEVDGIKLTRDNIIFPKHFSHYIDGVDISPDDIKRYIKEGIDFFRENPSSFFYLTGSGNTVVILQNYSGDEEYAVTVSKDYYTMSIPYEDEDYAVQDQSGWQWTNKGVDVRKSGEK